MRPWRVLIALLLFVLGVAGAQTLPECPQPTVGATDLSMTAFLVNAPCMLAENVATWAEWGLWAGIAKVGLTLTATFFFLRLGLAAANGNFDAVLMPLVIAVVVGSFLMPATSGQGIVPGLQAQALTYFRDTYTASARVGNVALMTGPNSVQAKTARLGEGIAVLLARTQHASVVEAQLRAAKAARDPAFEDPGLASRLYAEAVAKSNTSTNFAQAPGGPHWIFNVGYLLLYGLFAIFAGIIFVLGYALQVTMLLLPIAMAFAVLGNYKVLLLIFGAFIATLLSIGILPVTIASIAKIAIGIPAGILEQRVTSVNADVLTSLQRYETAIRAGCGTTQVGCVLQRDVVIPLQADLAGVKELFTTVLVALAALLIALSISGNTIRRIPAQIAGMLGAPGGGESSGTETGALSKILGTVGSMTGAGAAMKLAQQTMAKNALSKVGMGSGAGSKGATSGASGGAGSTTATPPPSVTAGPSAATGASHPNVPPSSVTGGPTSVGTASTGGGASPGTPGGFVPQSGVGRAYAGAAAVGSALSQIRANPGGTIRAGAASARVAAGQAGARVQAAAVNAAFSKPEQERFARVRQDVQGIQAARAQAAEARVQQAPHPPNPDRFETAAVRQGAVPNPQASAATARVSGSYAVGGASGATPNPGVEAAAAGAEKTGVPNRQAVAGIRAGGRADDYGNSVTVSSPKSEVQASPAKPAPAPAPAPAPSRAAWAASRGPAPAPAPSPAPGQTTAPAPAPTSAAPAAAPAPTAQVAPAPTPQAAPAPAVTNGARWRQRGQSPEDSSE